ncbi:hypothetical protein F5Y09DRAFT_356513 [Xylaria sp. FL1042]|nr:hypothetical protein F5Y09DRAFT_356513 [Xylaria sp. FL1042]
MKRQQSLQGAFPKRPGLVRPSPIAAQGNQPQVDQGPSNNPQPQSYAPKYYYNYRTYGNNNIVAFPLSDTLNGYGSPIMYPQSPILPTSTQQTPAQFAPAQLAPAPSFPPQLTEFNNTITQGGSSINSNIFPSHPTQTSNYPFQMNITAQSQQNVNLAYRSTQLPEQVYANHQAWESHQTQPVVNNTIRMPFAKNTPNPQGEWSVHGKAPFPIPESYGTEPYLPVVGHKRSAPEDVMGVDMVKLGEPKRKKVSKPRPKTKIASTPVPDIKNTPTPIPEAETASTLVHKTRSITPVSIPDSTVTPTLVPETKTTPTLVPEIEAMPTPGPESTPGFELTVDPKTLTTPIFMPENEVMSTLGFELTSYPETEKPSDLICAIEKPLDLGPKVQEQPVVIDLEVEAVGRLGPYDYLDHDLGAIKEFIVLEEERQAEEARQQKEREEEEAARLAEVAAQWVGDPCQYPAECHGNLRLPGCEYRAQAICVGTPGLEWFGKQDGTQAKGPLIVYAVAGPGGDGVEFKLVKAGCSVKEIMESTEVQFSDIWLNENFSDMDEKQVTRWSRYLLAAVPGVNDTITMWTGSGEL